MGMLKETNGLPSSLQAQRLLVACQRSRAWCLKTPAPVGGWQRVAIYLDRKVAAVRETGLGRGQRRVSSQRVSQFGWQGSSDYVRGVKTRAQRWGVELSMPSASALKP